MKFGSDFPDIQKKSIVQKGIIIKGEVVGDGHLTISGCVDGSVTLKNGHLVVTSTGCVAGDVVASQAFIDGEVRGHILADKKVVIGPKARIHGDVASKSLDISEGAICNGFLQIGKTMEIKHVVKSRESVS
jgi:cytoskeletal protein CcmA (bactofilin family)